MKTWIRRTLLGVFGATIALGGVAACGHHHGHGGWANMSVEERAKVRAKIIERVASRLDLDATQKAKLNVLADRLQEQRAALRGQGPDPRTQVRGLVAGDKFDRAGAQKLLTEKTAALNAKSPDVIAALGDFYDSLNPTQQARVREYMERGRRGWSRF